MSDGAFVSGIFTSSFVVEGCSDHGVSWLSSAVFNRLEELFPASFSLGCVAGDGSYLSRFVPQAVALLGASVSGLAAAVGGRLATADAKTSSSS